MIVGWAINSAMILLAAATFFKSGIQVEELQQAKSCWSRCWGAVLPWFLHWHY